MLYIYIGVNVFCFFYGGNVIIYLWSIFSKFIVGGKYRLVKSIFERYWIEDSFYSFVIEEVWWDIVDVDVGIVCFVVVSGGRCGLWGW